MRWRDLLWLVFSWVLQRRPEKDRETLRRILVDRQSDLALREEVQAVSEATKETWAQMMTRQITAQVTKQVTEQVTEQVTKQVTEQVAERAEARGAARSLRDTLIKFLRETFGELPEPLLTSIRACEDVERLQTAIFQ